MPNLLKHLPLVKDQIGFHQRMAEKFSDNPYRSSLHTGTARKFEELENALAQAQSKMEELSKGPPVKSDSPHRLAVTRDDLKGLPEELRRELSISDSDLEFLISELVDANGGMMSLDQLLIGLYKKTGEVNKRNKLTARLYRMRTIFSVAGKKGVYSTHPGEGEKD